MKIFGFRVCVKRTGHRRAKLDKHDFRGIFLGYSASDQNIRYLDLDSGITKVSHHAVFNEAWYSCSHNRPPTAQFLYDLGLAAQDATTSVLVPHAQTPKDKFDHFQDPTPSSLPMHLLPSKHSVGARAAKVDKPLPHSILEEFDIEKDCMANIYLSPDPYHYAFEETIDLRRFDSARTPTAGMNLVTKDDRLFLGSMSKSTPAARISNWRS